DGVAVHRAGARIDDARNLRLHARLEEAHGGVDIRGVRRPGILEGPGHAGQCRDMKDDVDPHHGTAAHRWFAEIATQKLDLLGDAGEIRLVAGTEIVDHANEMTERDQSLSEMRPDEPRPSRHQSQHRPPSLAWNE